jgi:hypothetical protein
VAGCEEPQGERLPVRTRTNIEEAWNLELGALHCIGVFAFSDYRHCETTGIRETDWGGQSINCMMRRMQRLVANAGLLAYVLLAGVMFG